MITPAELAKTIRTLLAHGRQTMLQQLALEQYLGTHAAQIAEWLEKYETD